MAKQIELSETCETLVRYIRRAGPIKSPMLEDLMGIRSSQIRGLVREARRGGTPIASSTNGYWIAKTKEEYEETLRHLRDRASSLTKTLKKIDKHTRWPK